MRRGLAISSACLVLLAGLPAAQADDPPAATPRCELTAFPPQPPPPSQPTGWRGLLYRAMKALDRSEAPAAAIKRLGGTRLVMRADADVFRTAILDDLRNDTRCLMREARIPHGGLAVHDGSVELHLRDRHDLQKATSALHAATRGAVDMSVQIGEAAVITMTPTEQGLADRLAAMLDRSVEVITRRIKDLGIKQAGVERDGADRIRIELPGVTDTSRLVGILGARGRLELRLVDATMSAEEARKTSVPLDDDLLYGIKDKAPWLVSKRVSVGGDDIVEVYAGLPDSGEPYVAFRFDARGTRDFARVTRENVGRQFAIVLDDAVISAPIIREPIVGGSGQITGRFTPREASDLAILLRGGTLPVRLDVVEQQSVAPPKTN